MRSALKRPDTTPLPTAQGGGEPTMVIAEERHFPNVGEGEAVPNIKDGVAPIQIWQSLICGEPVPRGSAVHGAANTLPRGITVDRVTVSVVSTEL